MYIHRTTIISIVSLFLMVNLGISDVLADGDRPSPQKHTDTRRAGDTGFSAQVQEKESGSSGQDSKESKSDSSGAPKVVAPANPDCVAVSDGQQLCRSQLQDLACRGREVAAWIGENPDRKATQADADDVNDRIRKQCINPANPDPALGLSRDDLVRMAFYQFEPQVLAPKVQPDPAKGDVAVNIPANFYSLANDSQDAPVTLLGENIILRAIPIRWRWNFDDDTRPHTSVYPGRECFKDRQPCYASNTVRHRFTLLGDFDVRVTVVFRGEYSINGDAFSPIEGTISRTSPAIRLHTLEARARLIDPSAAPDDTGLQLSEMRPGPKQYQPKKYRPTPYRPTPYRPTPYRPKKYQPHPYKSLKSAPASASS